jgi:hypothetical protein
MYLSARGRIGRSPRLSQRARRARGLTMRHLLAACCLATLLVQAASEQQQPWEQDDGGQERQRPRPRPMGRKASPVVRDMRPAVQRWARPANVANGALLLVSGLPVAMRGGLLNLQPIGLLLGGWVRSTNHALPCAQPGAPHLTRSAAPKPEPGARCAASHRAGLALWHAPPLGRDPPEAGS